MKKHIINTLLIACLFFFIASCESERTFEPTASTAITGITLINPAGVKKEYKVQADESGNIDITVEGSINMDLSKYRMSVNIANNSKIVSDTPFGEYLDFSKPYSFDVVAVDGSTRTYTINVNIFASQIAVKELWYKLGSEFSFSQHNNRSVGFSGDNLVVHDRSANGAYKYYDIKTGAYVGTLSNTGIDAIDALHMISDDAGNIINCSFAPNLGSNVVMYWWKGVNADPEKLVEWESTVNGNLGRKIYVKGDLTKLAYVYLTESGGNQVVRWEVVNGQVTSEEPDIIEVKHPVEGGWGTNGRVIPIELGKESNYFVNSSRKIRITYMDGATNSYIYNSEDHTDKFHQWLKNGGHAFDYVDMNGAKFLFIMEQNGANWLPSIFTVHNMMKDPDSINEIFDLVHTRKYEGWLDYPMDESLGSNGNVVGEVKAQVAPDGNSALVAFICTNGGIAVWDVKLD